MSLRSEIKKLASEFEREDNAKLDMWTWLPSYQAAKNGHNDYASEFLPPSDEVMKEASSVIAYLAGASDPDKSYLLCPCAEENCHGIVTLAEWREAIFRK